MSYQLYIAKRYLLSKKKAGFITIITIISIIGITVGVAALIVVLSIFNGFNSLVTSILVGFDPHLRIEASHNQPIENYQTIIHVLQNDSRVKAFSPYITGKAMIVSEDFSKVVIIKGVDPAKVGDVSGIREKIVLGKFLQETKNDANAIVLGLALSDRLNALVGRFVMLVSPVGFEQTVIQFAQPLMKKFKVVGIYESNNKEYDGLYAYISLASAQELFDLPGRVNGIELRLHNLNDAEDVKRVLEKQFGNSYNIFTWYDLHKDLYSVMKIERWVAYVILCMIIAVATFNLLGSMTMAVIEKTRDMGVLKSMGATDSGIVSIFLFEGIMIGVIGMLLGSLLGLTVTLLQKRYHLFPLDPNVYIIPALPVEVRWTDFVAVGLAAILLCIFASLYPAKRAAAAVPADAVRWE